MSAESSHADGVARPNEAATSGSPGSRSPIVERGYPIVGSLIEVLRDGPLFLSRIATKHPGQVVGFRLGPITCYLVTSPEHVQQVFQDHWRDYGKGGIWKGTRPVLGKGLASSEGELWRRQRRMMQPLFSPAYLASLADVMAEVVDEELLSLAKNGPSAVVDMLTEMFVISQRVILQTLFGSGIGRQEAEHLVNQLLIAFREMNLRMFLYFLPEGFPLPGDRIYQQAVAAIDDAIFRLIRARRASGEEREDLLSRLLRARDDTANEGMDDRQLRDELVTLFVAGNETTATALTWVWYLLDRNPEVDRQLRAEVSDVLGERRPTYADLARLIYTKHVFLEALRMYPPVWLDARFTDRDTTIGDYRIPAGSPVMLVPLVTQRDPSLWPEPDRFDPGRFTPERSAGRPHYAYYPFGGGPRKCIGESFAVMEAQIIIAMMVQRFRPRLVPGTLVVPISSSTLKPRYGVKMSLGVAPRTEQAEERGGSTT